VRRIFGERKKVVSLQKNIVPLVGVRQLVLEVVAKEVT